MMTELDLNLLLLWGIVIYLNTGIIINQICSSNEILPQFIKSYIVEKHDQGSDHLSIETLIALQMEEYE